MVLIVDDKPENIFALKKLLEVNNFDVDTALSGEEALKKVLKNNYALIILDVQMPDMDGFEVAETLSGYSKAKDIPIIFLSAASTDKKFITKGYISGGIDYVAKPVDPDILLLKVKTFHRLYEQARVLNEMQVTLQQEIESRKKAQYDQQRKTLELQSVLESIPQIAFMANAAGNIEYANEKWYVYSDHKNTFPTVYNREMPIPDFWQNIIASELQLPIEVCIRKQYNAEYRYHLLSLIPVKEDQVIVKWVGTLTDIHEQKLAKDLLEKRVEERTRELKETNITLEISNVNLQQFAWVVSHDLREPLRKIQVFNSIINERYGQGLENDLATYLGKINASAKRMIELINDLMDFSRLDVAFVFQKTDLNSLINDVAADLEILIKEKKAMININRLPVIEAVPGLIREVFQNLVINALKFARKDLPPVVNITSEIIATKEIDALPIENGNYCRIVIADNGIGFNEKYLDKIFAIFQRLHSREEYEGTGIGLAIVKKIIERHNGMITAKSREGEGAAFIIVLPINNTTEQQKKELAYE